MSSIAAGVAAVLMAAAAQPAPRETRPVTETPGQTPRQTAEGVADLPFARGRAFRTLDEYLGYRKTLGAQDAPYYREISPGVYELWGGRRPPGVTPPTFTRQQLLAEFGFKD